MKEEKANMFAKKKNYMNVLKISGGLDQRIMGIKN